MKTEFTVADQALQWMSDPRGVGYGHFSASLRKLTEPGFIRARSRIREARKMELSDDFIEMVVKASAAKSERMLDRCDLANLPFKSLWVEYNNHARVKAQFLAGRSQGITAETPKRVGWLLYRHHDDVATGWRAICFSHAAGDPAISPAPCAYQFGFNGIAPLGDWNEATRTLAAKAWGYATAAGSQTPVFVESLAMRGQPYPEPLIMAPIMTEFKSDPRRYGKPMEEMSELFFRACHEGRGDLRFLITMLAMINYVPIKYVHAPKTGFYKHRLKNLPFMATDKVVIDAGRKDPFRLVARTLTAHETQARHRRHEVRGHWRHWLTSPRCTSYDRHHWDRMESGRDRCLRCGTLRRWIPEHYRGDAELGFVQHTYEVVG